VEVHSSTADEKKRREQVRLVFSADRRTRKTTSFSWSCRASFPPLTFYVYQRDELQPTASTELASWLDGMALDHLLEFQHARSETLETLEVEIQLRKPKEAAAGPFERRGQEEEPHFWALREVGINLTAHAD
jgi:hypothetical protein